MLRNAEQKQAFDLTNQELSIKLKATLDSVLTSQRKDNIPLVYRNGFCVRKNQFIHEYADGRKFLIQQNQTNSEEKILRQL